LVSGRLLLAAARCPLVLLALWSTETCHEHLRARRRRDTTTRSRRGCCCHWYRSSPSGLPLLRGSLLFFTAPFDHEEPCHDHLRRAVSALGRNEQRLRVACTLMETGVALLRSGAARARGQARAQHERGRREADVFAVPPALLVTGFSSAMLSPCCLPVPRCLGERLPKLRRLLARSGELLFRSLRRLARGGARGAIAACCACSAARAAPTVGSATLAPRSACAAMRHRR